MESWKSPNKIWWIHRREIDRMRGKPESKLVIENMTTGYVDIPIVYKNRKVAFDNPFILPKYVKQQYKKMVGGY